MASTLPVDKENQTSNQLNTAAAGSIQSKKGQLKDDGVVSLSPYETKMQTLRAARVAAGDDAVLLMLSDEDSLLEKSGVLEEEEEAEELDGKERLEALRKLSATQVDKGVHAMMVSRACLKLKQEYHDAILYADSRWNKPGDGMVMLNTYSSFCMYPVISKQFTAATKELNKAEKILAAASEIPGVAKKALEVTVAAILAAHTIDHWRHDTETPEEVEKLAKRLVKMVKTLLGFTDAELGWTDNFSRQGWLGYLQELAEDWKSTASGCLDVKLNMKFRVPKNGQGMGRSLSAANDANPAPKKKLKASPSVAVAASNGGASITAYFSNIHAKLNQRVKTLVQLQVTDLQDPKRVDHVVVSGAQDMKKLHQFVAYLTGTSPLFQYHSQRGSSVKGCRFELNVPGYRTCWISQTGDKKSAAAANADLVLDKSIKIVQVFQGLNCSPNEGMIYDSDLAKTVATTEAALVFVTASGNRFSVQVQAIAPQKTEEGRVRRLPRIVLYRENQKKGGLGLGLQQAKSVIMGDRNDPPLILIGGATKGQKNKIHFNIWTNPICNQQGGDVNHDPNSWGSGLGWTAENVQASGPPDSYAP